MAHKDRVIKIKSKSGGVGAIKVDPRTKLKRKKEKPTNGITKKPRSEPRDEQTRSAGRKVDLKKKLRSAKIEGMIESATGAHPLKRDRATARGEKKLTVKSHPKTSKLDYKLSNRGTTGPSWRAGGERVQKFFDSGDAEKNYKKTGRLFTNYSGKMKKGGRAGFQHGGRTRLLEELGRVEAEPSNRNRRAEISRVHGELNRGYKSGCAVLKGKKVGIQIK